MTRDQVATIVAARALVRAGASADLTYRLALGHEPASFTIGGAVPTYERTGKTAIVHWVNHSVHGLEITREHVRDVATWNELVGAVARSLASAVFVFRCTDIQEVHFYTDWGAGTCRIDGTPLEHVTS